MNKDKMDNLDPGDMPVTVPLVRDAAAIKQLANNKYKENLGLKVQPGGKCAFQLKGCKEKVEDWTGKAKTSHLPARAVWQSYTQKMWSSMKYGLAACAATLKELENGLGLTYVYLISKVGAAILIPAALRYVPHYYCGMELHRLPVETTLAQIACLGTITALGTTLTAAIENMQVKIGVTGCPLLYDYNKYDCLATNTWTKTLWKK